MKKMHFINKIFLLFTILISSYFIVNGFDDVSVIPVILYTIGLGALVLASLLLLLFGIEILENKLVVIFSTLIPFSISLGLIFQYVNTLFVYYFIFIILEYLLIIYARYSDSRIASILTIAFFHGIAGLIIFLVPIYFFINTGSLHFIFISIGAFFIGIGGILLIFVKFGKNYVPSRIVFSLLPLILLILSIFFGLGLSK